MTSATPLYGLPYPTPTDAASQVPAHIQSLAQQVESTIAGFGGIAAPSAWLTVGGGGGAVGYGAGWAAYGGGFWDLQYRKVGAMVYLRGLTKRTGVPFAAGGGVGSPMITLPVGYRPVATRLVYVANIDGGAGRVDVQADGTVIVNSAANTGSFVSLSGIDFAID